MENMVEEDIMKKLDDIYGIEESKWEILNYIKYLEISKKNHFANYNVIIHNSSDYPSETKIKLVNFLYEMLEKNNIINTDYEFITINQIKNFEEFENDNELEDKDLIIIDAERIEENLTNYRENIVAIIEKFKDKIFIIIDNSFCIGEANARFSKYFDWFFRINKISENNKKAYVKNLLEKNHIEVNCNCDYIDNLIENPFFIVKSKMSNIILQCKLNDITEITNEVSKKYFFEDKRDTLPTRRPKITNNINEDLSFDSLIGIDNIKKEINKIVNYAKFCKGRQSNMPMLHMCFTGNPGTGKTTVARIIGQVFRKEKILSNGNFVEIHGRDLIGRYVGWTAKEVQNYVRRAKGGILFIDEAYSLNSDRRGSFEDEAISTLIKEMEDNRNDLCVILAGYQEEMKDLIERNPGFESRIQFYLNFPNYNEEELYKIFKNYAKKDGYSVSSQVKKILQENFKENCSNKTFSNGRYVRNLYEKVKIEQANRIFTTTEDDIDAIKKCDIENVLENTKQVETPKFKIGFAS